MKLGRRELFSATLVGAGLGLGVPCLPAVADELSGSG